MRWRPALLATALGASLAAGAATAPAAVGPLGTVACAANTDCAPTAYCRHPPGSCTATGECLSRPGICTDVFDPVCGCDGNTYSNACHAAAAGASVSLTGACPRDLRCTTNADCESGEFCARPAGTCEGAGECTARPSICIEVFDPVCGCDGTTYSNTCVARSAGVNVVAPGECPPAAASCSATPDCPPAAFCDRPVGSCSAAGTCQPRPDVCATVPDPVCGCDAETYASACAAAAAGVAVATSGACEDGVCTGRPECGSAEVVVPEAPVVPRVEVTCRASSPESGECEAAGFLTSAAAVRVLEAGAPPDLGRRVTRRGKKKLRDGGAFLRLKLNPLGRRLLKKFGRQGAPLSVTIVVSVRTATGRADIRQLVQLRKLRGR